MCAPPSDTMTWCGEVYEVNADFRVILRILRLLNGETPPAYAGVLAARLFFRRDKPEDIFGAVLAFLEACERPYIQDGVSGVPAAPADGGSAAFDYEIDAREIYASFWQTYGIDLHRVAFLHWAEFRALLTGLPEDCVFRQKLALRGLDTSKLRGEVRLRAEAAKAAVQLPERLTAGERQAREAFEAEWG